MLDVGIKGTLVLFPDLYKLSSSHLKSMFIYIIVPGCSYFAHHDEDGDTRLKVYEPEVRRVWVGFLIFSRLSIVSGSRTAHPYLLVVSGKCLLNS